MNKFLGGAHVTVKLATKKGKKDDSDGVSEAEIDYLGGMFLAPKATKPNAAQRPEPSKPDSIDTPAVKISQR